MLLTGIPKLLLLVLALGVEPSDVEIRQAVDKALPTLLAGTEGYLDKRDCFSCHHQAIPVLALTLAKKNGFAVPEEAIQAQVEFTADSLAKGLAEYRKGKGQGGGVETAGTALWTLELGGRVPDELSEVVAAYLLDRDKKEDLWRASSRRPPSEGSLFGTAFVAIRGMKAFLKPDRRKEFNERMDRVRKKIVEQPAKDTEDRVFKLWSLHGLEADSAQIDAAADDLKRRQKPDGSWSQTDEMAGDAYATGSVLVVLRRTGRLSAEDPVSRRGAAFLLKSQLPDGTWKIKSRSKPFQPYFESGFPHGADQFISMAATAWATSALVLGLK